MRRIDPEYDPSSVDDMNSQLRGTLSKGRVKNIYALGVGACREGPWRLKSSEIPGRAHRARGFRSIFASEIAPTRPFARVAICRPGNQECCER